MTKDDLKVWAHHICLQKLDPSISNLLQWMEEELLTILRLELQGAVLACRLGKTILEESRLTFEGA